MSFVRGGAMVGDVKEDWDADLCPQPVTILEEHRDPSRDFGVGPRIRCRFACRSIVFPSVWIVIW